MGLISTTNLSEVYSLLKKIGIACDKWNTDKEFMMWAASHNFVDGRSDVFFKAQIPNGTLVVNWGRENSIETGRYFEYYLHLAC